MGNKKAVARERVKAMREEQARKDRRKEQMMRFGLVGAAIVAVAIIVLAVQASRSADDAPIVMPAGVTEETGGVPLSAENPDSPLVEVWFDFSCPHCASFEAANGDTLKQLAESGDANVVYRPVTFVGGANSTRATNAWACAVEEGMGEELMDATFAQGTGYTNRIMLDIGQSVGLESGDFRSCVNDGTYNGWVAASHEHGTRDRTVSTTPTIFIEGEVLDTSEWTPEGIVAAVATAAGDTGARDADSEDDDAADSGDDE
jgi:protein-disulfide isomerase